MIKIPEKNGYTVFFDVDDTLIIWANNTALDAEACISITDNTGTILARPHQEHIHALMDAHNAGHTVVVWSQGGADWAETVVKALQIEKFVDCCITKPTHLYDDLDYYLWLPKRLFLSQSQ